MNIVLLSCNMPYILHNSEQKSVDNQRICSVYIACAVICVVHHTEPKPTSST